MQNMVITEVYIYGNKNLKLKSTESHTKQAITNPASSKTNGGGIALPAVPVLQQKENAQLVVQRVVANFDHLTPEAKQDAHNFFNQWRALLGTFKNDAGGLCVYDRPAVQVLLNQILTDVDVTPNPVNRLRFLTFIGVTLLPPPAALPVVNIAWNISAGDRARLDNFPRFLASLSDSRNYDAVTGQPRFANAHADDTGNGQWKLQADRELLGAGSVDRLCIDVVVAADGTVNVTVNAFLENAH